MVPGLGAMTLLARARATPEDTPPQRLPGLSRHLSDVKHLWQQHVWAAGEVTNDRHLMLGGQIVEHGQHVAFLLNNPVAPLVYSCPSSVTGGKYAYLSWQFIQNRAAVWNTVSPHQDTSGLSPRYVISVFDKVAPGGVLTQELTENLDPCGLIDGRGRIVQIETSGLVENAPQRLLQTPVFVSDANKAKYSLMPGREVVVAMRHMASLDVLGPIPANAAINLAFQFVRYNGTEPEEYSALQSIAMSGGVSEHAMTYTTSHHPMLARSGYFRIVVSSIALSSATEWLPGFVELEVAWKIGGYDGRVWAQPTSEVFNDATYMFRKCRMTAASLRIKNITALMHVGGDAAAGLAENHLGQWHNQTTDSLLAAAGAARTGYRGPASKGAYTWLHLTDESEHYEDATYEVRHGSGVVVQPRVHLDKLNLTHFVLIDVGQDGDSLSRFTAQIRVDLHLEFISSSPLANNSVCAYDIEDLARANMILAAAPVAYENPFHLPTIWAAIRKASGAALRAGAGVVARAALEALLL